MGQNETAPNNQPNSKLTEKKKENNKEDKDSHMIEILKKENDILKKNLNL